MAPPRRPALPLAAALAGRHARPAGPLLQAFNALDATEGVELAAELLALARRYNRSGDATMVVPVEYLEVLAVRR